MGVAFCCKILDSYLKILRSKYQFERRSFVFQLFVSEVNCAAVVRLSVRRTELLLYYYCYYYYYYFLLQLSFHSVAVVLTLVQTTQIIYINETIQKHSTRNTNHSKYKYTY